MLRECIGETAFVTFWMSIGSSMVYTHFYEVLLHCDTTFKWLVDCMLFNFLSEIFKAIYSIFNNNCTGFYLQKFMWYVSLFKYFRKSVFELRAVSDF